VCTVNEATRKELVMNINRSKKSMLTAKTGYIVLSSLLTLAGIFLICKPGISVSVVGIVTAIAMICFGIFKVIGYFFKDLYRLAFEYDLAFGVLLILLGIIELSKPGTLLSILCTTFGIAALADGLFKIQISLNAKPFGIKNWWLIMALAVITSLIGILLIFNPVKSSEALMVLFGITVMIEGILNLATVLFTVKIIDHQKPDVIDVDYVER